LNRRVETRLLTGPVLRVWIANLGAFTSFGALLLTLPLYSRDELAASDIGVGIAVGAGSISALLLSAPAGRIADRRGRRKVIVAGALDEVRETLEVGEAIVQPKSASILTVDLSRFKRGLGTLRFSGRMVAKGFARPASGGLVSDLVYSPSAYFHKEGSWLVAYRSDALVQQFRAGDFANRAERQRRWAAGRGLRLGGIGTLGAGLNLTDNDGGPQEGTQP